jgi:hypothetical protein
MIKFLDADDVLERDCVAKMSRLTVGNPSVGLVFSRRRIVLDGALGDGQAWLVHFAELHRHFQAIRPLNDGRVLFAEWLADGLRTNWIGEPSAVMVSRRHLEVSGGFGRYVRQTVDADLWARLLPHALVGFVDEKLVTYRLAQNSVGATARRTRTGWIDRLWTLETLVRDPELRRAYPEIEDLLRTERRQAYRTAIRSGNVKGGQHVPLVPYRQYLKYRALLAAGRQPSLFAIPPHTIDRLHHD